MRVDEVPAAADQPVGHEESAIMVAASGAMRRRLDVRRWHFQHGPIDLVITLDGDPIVVRAAIDDAFAVFAPMLGGLVERLPMLRRPVEARDRERLATDWCDPLRPPGQALDAVDPEQAAGLTAQRMLAACLPFADCFVTPMAAVAGSVADVVLVPMRREGIQRAMVNNGGDIALHLTPGQCWRIAIVVPGSLPGEIAGAPGMVCIDADSPVRGLATSGWRGRSLSLGIADAVTVLATRAADADVAATLIANAVDLDAPTIERRPASACISDSDLGDLPVTIAVGHLDDGQVDAALGAGQNFATRHIGRHGLSGARLQLGDRCRIVGPGFEPH